MSNNTFPEFFVVWNIEHGIPYMKHNTLTEAKNEAKRLAILNPGQVFYVLHSLGKMVKQEPVEWIESDDLPF